MTEWDAAGYAHISSLQKAMAEEVLALLDLKGSERILDAGCGEGKITAQIAERSRMARWWGLILLEQEPVRVFVSVHFYRHFQFYKCT